MHLLTVNNICKLLHQQFILSCAVHDAWIIYIMTPWTGCRFSPFLSVTLDFVNTDIKFLIISHIWISFFVWILLFVYGADVVTTFKWWIKIQIRCTKSNYVDYLYLSRQSGGIFVSTFNMCSTIISTAFVNTILINIFWLRSESDSITYNYVITWIDGSWYFPAICHWSC